MQLKYGVSPYSLIMGMLSCTILAIILWAFRKNKFFIQHFGPLPVTILAVCCLLRTFFVLEIPALTKVIADEDWFVKVNNVIYRPLPAGANYGFDVTLSLILCSIWGIVTAFLIIRYFFAQYRLRRETMKAAYPATGHILELVAKVAKELDVTDYEVFYSPDITSPSTMGISHCRLILPDDLVLNDRAWEYVLRHEFTHQKNHDIIVMLAATMLVCFYWWNPFVHLAFRELRQIMELRCDMAATSTLERSERELYLDAMLAVVHLTQKKTERKRLQAKLAEMEKRRTKGRENCIVRAGKEIRSFFEFLTTPYRKWRYDRRLKLTLKKFAQRTDCVCDYHPNPRREGVAVALTSLAMAVVIVASYSVVFQPKYTPPKEENHPR